MYKRITAAVAGGLLALTLMLSPREEGTVTVCCPGGPAATTYYYDLVGVDFLEAIVVDYSPKYPETIHATLDGVPLGTYRLLENGVERARVEVTRECTHILVEAGEDWPLMSPSGKEW